MRAMGRPQARFSLKQLHSLLGPIPNLLEKIVFSEGLRFTSAYQDISKRQ